MRGDDVINKFYYADIKQSDMTMVNHLQVMHYFNIA